MPWEKRMQFGEVIIISWSAMIGTLINIAAIVAVICELKRLSRKRISNVLASMQRRAEEGDAI